MSRTRAKQRPRTRELPADPVLIGLDVIDWAGARIARGGRNDALLGRVEALRLSIDGRSIDARVRGNRPLPYRVAVEVLDSRVAVRCTCSRDVSGPCRHAVAAVEALRFPAPRDGGARRPGRSAAGRGRIIQPGAAVPGFVIIGGAERTRTREERIASARAEEVQLRRNRARRERARVEPHVDTDTPLRWNVTPRSGAPSGVVTLRGLDRERFACDCSDFGHNELRTCSHVERVRNWRSRQRKRDRRPVPATALSVWCWPRIWADRVPEPLAEIRVDGPPPAPGSLDRYFDADGWLRAAPADRTASGWARSAVAAARRSAGRHGWDLDLDASVAERIRRSATDERIAARRCDLIRNDDAWGDVLSRVRLKLHPYQEDGARFLARTGRAFLADDMGLGKTVQAVVATMLLSEGGFVRRTLVVCPASLKHQWKHEIAKACGESARVIEGLRGERLAAYRNWRNGFLILNYELILRDLDAIREAGADLVILDEAQRIKNWSTKTARAVKRLDSRLAFVLTGTPLENRLLELHSLVEFLHPRAAGPRWRMLPFHAVTEPRGRVIAYEGLDVLRGRLREFFLRRERSAVQDQLPPRTDNTFWTRMSTPQLKPYGRHAAAAAAVLSKPPPLAPQDVRTLLSSLTSMRILCNALAQYEWEAYASRLNDPTEGESLDVRAFHSPKLEEFTRVLDDLLDESNSKVVVFSQWERMLRLAHHAVRSLLVRRDLHAEVFHGGLGARARSEMLDAFRGDPAFRVLFSTDAGGLGLNLQDAASIVVNLEVPWNPAVLEQRVGRVHRMGQQRSVQVLHFVTGGAIEERVLQVLESKRALFDGLLVNEADQVVLDGAAGTGWVERARILLGDTDET